jgi:hypothetical protein
LRSAARARASRRQPRREIPDARARQRVARDEAVELGVGVELQHLDGVLERRPAADVWRRARPTDRHDGEVERRREPAVQPQLVPAETVAARQCAEVEEREPQRLLDLVRIPPREQHPGDVRLDETDRSNLVVVTGRAL